MKIWVNPIQTLRFKNVMELKIVRSHSKQFSSFPMLIASSKENFLLDWEHISLSLVRCVINQPKETFYTANNERNRDNHIYHNMEERSNTRTGCIRMKYFWLEKRVAENLCLPTEGSVCSTVPFEYSEAQEYRQLETKLPSADRLFFLVDSLASSMF